MDRGHLRRRLTAVLIADVVGYSRLMGVDEEGTHLRLAGYVKDLIEPKIVGNRGRLIRTAGDGFLVEFESAVDAVRCGLDIQRELAERNAGVPADRRIQLRIGINAGDVIVGDQEIYGNSVNIAARLEELAEPGGICVTRNVRDQLQSHPDLVFEDRGQRKVKNFSQPIRIYRVRRVEQQQRRAFPADLFDGTRAFSRAVFFAHRRSAIWTSILLAVAASITVAALPLRRDYALLSPRASIMVLPFRNVSSIPGQDYFADAVTDDVTTDLSRLSDTVVISPGTAFTYKGKAVDPRQIGREFGVRYLLEGSIRKDGMQVQTNAQLVDARSAAHIWADRFDTELADLSELQNAITGRIASSLNIQLVQAENRRAITERPADPDAIDLRLRATALLMSSITPEHSLAARRHLEESVRLDPHSAESWSQLATLLVGCDYLNHWNEAKDSPEAAQNLLQRGEAAVQEALKIDPSIAQAHFADGFIRRAKADHQGALDAFDRAVQLDANFASALVQKANQLVMVGRPKEAPAPALKAITLSPRDPAIGLFYWVLGRAYFVVKDYSNAIVWLRKSAEVRPNLWYSRAYLLAAAAHLGRQEQPEVRAALSDYNEKFSGYTVQRIRDLYEKELPHTDPLMQASIQALYNGLQKAGVP
jgi:class 3 adenylate cyclase/TolB-like protein/tetratricopeptide (TPR) repeat protein